MIAILTVIAALPLGLLIRNRLYAYLVYAIAFAQVYTYQSVNLLVEWVNGSSEAFPHDGSTNTLDYFAFTTGIYTVGFGLVTLGHWLRNRRRTRTNEVALDPQV